MDVSFEVIEGSELTSLYCELLKHKVFDEELPSSRIKNIYEGVRLTPDGMVAALARNGAGDLIGIVTCEKTTQPPFSAFKVKDPFKFGSKIKSKEDWNFVPSGFISMYVKSGYRNQGVAKSLLNNLESYMFTKQSIPNSDVPLFNAAAKAVSFIADYSLYSLPVDVSEKSLNFPSRMHFLTEAVNSMKQGEEVWSYKCSVKSKVPNATPKVKM